MCDAEFRQRLPSLDEAHLCLDEAHLGDVLVGLQNPRRELCSETSASGTGLTAALPAPRSPHWEQYGSTTQRNGDFCPEDVFLLFFAQRVGAQLLELLSLNISRHTKQIQLRPA